MPKRAKLSLDDAKTVSIDQLPDPSLLDVLSEPPDEVTLFEGDLALGTDELDLGDYSGAVVVLGDLVTKGDVFSLERERTGAALVVAGALKARNLIAGGSHVLVKGPLALKNTLVGLGDVGSVSVEGNLDAKAVFLAGFSFCHGARLRAPVMDHLEDNPVADYGPDDDFRDLVQRDVLVDGDVDHQALLDRVRISGKTPLKSAANPSRVIVEKAIKKLVDKGKPVIELDLSLPSGSSSNKQMRDIPDALCDLEELEVLSIEGHYALRSIPESFSRLKNLRELSLRGCHIGSVHESFGDLPKLESLDFSYNDCPLPESVGKLTSLRRFKMYGYSEGRLPESAREWTNLEELILSCGNHPGTIEFPAFVLELESLRDLQLGGMPLASIPPEITRLEKLESLHLGSSLMYLESIPDLSGMTSLKKIDFDGRSGWSFHPRPNPKIIRDILNIESLEWLGFWSWKGVDWPEDTFAKLKGLKYLDMSFTEATRLPESFFEIEDLRTLRWCYCTLESDQLERVRQTFPDCELVSQ